MVWRRLSVVAVVLASACSSSSVEPFDALPGVDGAGRNDSGVSLDAAPVDRGVAVDAGFEDAAALDAEDRDAAPEDAIAETDAAEADSAPADASEPDATELDAAPVDAGAPCPIAFDETIDAVLRVSADDDRQVWVNEVLADTLMPARTWPTITVTTVSLFRHPARANVIAVDARNYQRIDGLDRGLLLDLTVSSTSAPVLITDNRWRVRSGTTAGFELITYVDSSWQNAVEEVQHPGGPYGALFGSTGAYWIWLYNAAIPAAQKPVLETMAARRTFYILVNGTLSDSPGSCP